MERNRRGDLPQGFSRGFGSRDAAVVSIEPLIHCQPKQSTLGRRSRRPFNFVTRFARSKRYGYLELLNAFNARAPARPTIDGITRDTDAAPID
jgi:hypothetical protein